MSLKEIPDASDVLSGFMAFGSYSGRVCACAREERAPHLRGDEAVEEKRTPPKRSGGVRRGPRGA